MVIVGLFIICVFIAMINVLVRIHCKKPKLPTTDEINMSRVISNSMAKPPIQQQPSVNPWHQATTSTPTVDTADIGITKNNECKDEIVINELEEIPTMSMETQTTVHSENRNSEIIENKD